MLSTILSLPRSVKRLIALLVDICALLFSLLVAFSVRNEQLYFPTDWNVIISLVIAIPVSLLIFTRLGLYRAVVRYMAISALNTILLGVISSALVFYVALGLLGATVPVSVIFNFALMSLVIVGGSRLIMRAVHEQDLQRRKARVLIYGAGSAGRQLAQALLNGEEYRPVAFCDDDPTLQGSTMLGLSVISPDKLSKTVNDKALSKVLLAIPSASKARRKEILEVLEPLSVQVQTIPGMADVVDGSMAIDELQDVRVEDLLGRDPVEPRRDLMDRNIRGRSVLVSGAGGSIGSELCRQIAKYDPKVLILVEICEFNLYAIERELQQGTAKQQRSLRIIPVLCSIQNRNRLTEIMRRFNVETVYHAAAYKHVPMVEFNIVEGVRNNVFGTWHIAEAAVASGVRDFVLISTDKAVRPTNVMGATKRFAELILQGMAKRPGNSTHFSMVRFGNVLGSSGSVVPLFRQQILVGGPVTVTDPEITRYFMTIPEAAQLVIQAGAMGSLAAFGNNGDGNQLTGACGQVFVLDMGEPVKIYDLAIKLIRLMGLKVKDSNHPDGDIAITFSGLRPGEKLYEELLIGDNVLVTDHPRIMTAMEHSLEWDELTQLIEQLDQFCSTYQVAEIHSLLKDAPLAFTPSSAINDVLWVERKDRSGSKQ